MRRSRQSSSSSSTPASQAKHIITLSPTFYKEHDFLRDKTPIDSRAVRSSFVVNVGLTLGEAIASHASGRSIVRTLGELIDNISVLDEQVPRDFSSKNAYINELCIDGAYNDSPMTFFAGFSEFARGLYSYAHECRLDTLDKEVVDRLGNQDQDFFSMRITPSKILDGEGRVDNDCPMQRAIDEEYESGDVPHRAVSDGVMQMHPCFKIVQAEIELYKGVSASMIKQLLVPTVSRQTVTVPLNSLLANSMSENLCTLVCRRHDDGKQKFNPMSDYLAQVPIAYATALRNGILAKANAVRIACVHDIRDLKFSLLPTFIDETWSPIEGTSDLLNLKTQERVSLDTRYNVRVRVSVDAIYYAHRKTSAAFMVDRTSMNIKDVWHHEDIDSRTGKLKMGARPYYSVKCEDLDDNVTSTTASSSEDSGDGAASSSPVVNDDD